MIVEPNLKYQVQMWQAIFCLLYWVVLFFIYVPQIKAPSNKGIGYFVFFVLSTIYAVFAFTTGDFFHYQELYDWINVAGRMVHMEAIYEWFIVNSFNNYYVWRLWVWGMALALLIYICKVLRLNAKFACLIYVLVLLYYAIELRQALAFALLYLGWSFLLRQNKNKMIDYIVGLLLIACSFFFHKSMYIYILLTFFAYFALYGGLSFFVVSWILFPFLYSSLYLFAGDFLLNVGQFFSVDTEKTYSYLNRDAIVININGIVQLIFQRIGLITLFVYSIKKIYFENALVFKHEKFFLVVSYFFIYLSFLFYGQPFAGGLYQRIWDASYFTMAIFLASFLYRQRRTRFFKFAVYSLSLITLYELLLVLYHLM